jgi:hypothetical protein
MALIWCMCIFCDAQSGPEAALAAAARLPPEPEPGEPGACPLAVRFPDGQRRARVFPGAANIGALRDFCVAHSPEAAAGRAFALSEPIPGARHAAPCYP